MVTPQKMDARLRIFELWYTPENSLLRERVKQYNSLDEVDYRTFILVSRTNFKCGRCHSVLYVGSSDATWVIAFDPIKYLSENEEIVCMNCSSFFIFRNMSIDVCVQSPKSRTMMVITPRNKYHQRYIHNILHDVYIPIDRFDWTLFESNSSILDKTDVVYRMLSPIHNPFFYIENTLFTILYVVLELKTS
jgi:hypothetical protein